jgi:hypothetical protein
MYFKTFIDFLIMFLNFYGDINSNDILLLAYVIIKYKIFDNVIIDFTVLF